MTEYTGKVVHFLHRNGDFAIALMETEKGERIKILGSLYGVDKGEVVTVRGEWRTHPKHGKQFAVDRWERPMPKTRDQVVAYLSSKYVKGCGKKRAKLIVRHLGDRALEKIMNEGASCLIGIKGIGTKRAEQIAVSIKSSFELQKVMMALLPYGLSPSMVAKVYKHYGSQSVEVVQRNPYKLTELDLVGFITADEIAAKVGINPSSPYRIDAAIQYVLTETCYNGGHCYVPVDELICNVTSVLGRKSVVPEDTVRHGLEELAAHDRVVWEGDAVYPKHVNIYEVKLAQKLAYMAGRSGEAVSSAVIENEIRRYQAEHRMILAEGQRDAIREMFRRQIMILTGGPGTGKTTTVRAMIELYRRQHPKAHIGLAAPTGRASRRLSEVTGLSAETIHMLLGFRPGQEPEYGEHLPLPYDLLIVDEWSMTDIQLAYYLFRAISLRTKVVLVGDADQLPSVGPGNVLRDMIDAGIPHVRLTEIFRQAQESQIVTNAHRINQGKPIVADPEKDDFFFIEQEEPQRIAQLIERSILRLLDKGYGLQDILVLSPMKKGPIGTHELNKRLQTIVNPPSAKKAEWTIGERTYRQGDKIIQVKNDYEKGIMNGDLGTILEVGFARDEDGETDERILVCEFGGQRIVYTQDDLKNVQLAYAVTVHKSQGSQAPAVIMPVSTSHYVMLARNLVYTGMTRAERLCVMIGTKKALAIAIQNNQVARRNTRLKERIVALMKAGDDAHDRHRYADG
ncbi:ATP-dependent RecD-like DNA helicase [Cohnella thermotolerans]|uniref:SF1B family DNA helicase RecD2 n=1 Tax=Cohnella thermotolerans TaxID=329858 RepID=UPI0003FACF2A|nr:ATP-dependent RecD-like DNA helicase [Cohnella thermotolerans]